MMMPFDEEEMRYPQSFAGQIDLTHAILLRLLSPLFLFSLLLSLFPFANSYPLFSIFFSGGKKKEKGR